MSLIFVDIDAKCGLPICASDTVYLCLDDVWADRTDSGLAFAIGMVTAINKVVDTSTTTICCNDVVISTVMCRYQIQVDDSQFKQDPSTLLPYLLTTTDVNEIFPYNCTLDKVLDETYLDAPNTINTADDVVNTNTLAFPVIRVDAAGVAALHSSSSIVLPGGDFTVVDSLVTYTSSPGKVIPLELCDIIETCFDGVTITRTGAGGTYQAAAAVVHTFTNGTGAANNETETYTGDGTVIFQGPGTLTHTDACSSPGPAGWLAGGLTIAGLDWTIFRVPEHATLSQTVVFTDSAYNAIGGGAPEVSLLINGNSNTKTDAYREVTFNNPSNCRPMAYLVFADSSFAGEQSAGAVIWGSSIWIDGVKIANQNGRSLAGFNISWTDGVGLFQDHTMPAHHYAGVIPAGGSVIVGLDFGDSDVFSNIGTPGAVSVESRVISIIGSTT